MSRCRAEAVCRALGRTGNGTGAGECHDVREYPHVVVGPAVGIVIGGALGAGAGLGVYFAGRQALVDALLPPGSDGDAGTLMLPVVGSGFVVGAVLGGVAGFLTEAALRDSG